MSTVACPNGHQSTDPEWCDTCGARIGAPAGGSDPAVPVAPQAASQVGAAPVGCPHCGEANLADALFCESCGYDFTTGQTPAGAAPTIDPPAPVLPTSPLSARQPVPLSNVEWIVVVEVDPEWYALKGALADQPCPPVSSRTVPLANHTALIGRTSASRGVKPEVALDGDTGVSRRHAQFVRDADQLTVVDLSSTNGTYVVTGATAPGDDVQPLVPGVPSVLADGDRVYVGAWTRLTVRLA